MSGISLTGMLGAGAESLRLGPGLAAMAVISLLLGYLTFSLLAGLAGCCCDSMDDVEGANMKVVLAVMAGYLVSCIAGTMSGTGISLFVSLFPPGVHILCSGAVCPGHYRPGDPAPVLAAAGAGDRGDGGIFRQSL